MSDSLEHKRFGRGTVQENLARALAAGRLIERPDTHFDLPKGENTSETLRIQPNLLRYCLFLDHFLFRLAYDRSTVPYGCRACYKVKIDINTLAELVALRDLLEQLPYFAKCGVDIFNPYSRGVYAAYLYCIGLSGAQDALRDLRAQMDGHPVLGHGLRLTIKRGCSPMEAACGPSDRWTFREDMAALEDQLLQRFQPEPAPAVAYRWRRLAALTEWLQVAYMTGDDTYLEFTGGRPLRSPTVRYPEKGEEEVAAE